MAPLPQPGALPPPQQVPPQPSPVTVQLAKASGPAGDFVVLSVSGVSGTSVYFLPPEVAEMVGQSMLGCAAEVRTGLSLPRTGLQVP